MANKMLKNPCKIVPKTVLSHKYSEESPEKVQMYIWCIAWILLGVHPSCLQKFRVSAGGAWNLKIAAGNAVNGRWTELPEPDAFFISSF
ncbi:hypothetical protein E2C01_002744 [Portunus trituberculatus]|uniref:Uncharacterized protein n=1 Tax=Portunus trituberculatus TaxID=210409 RepID=A0A5B7CP16_PORTR|nr:hypothetical protein [Portunus trituberculatus]